MNIRLNFFKGTPADRAVYEQSRSVILNMTDTELQSLGWEDFHNQLQFLSPVEIMDMTQKKQRLEASRGLLPEHEELFGTSEEAKNYVLNSSDDLLMQKSDEELERFFIYLTAEEKDEVKHRLMLGKQAKRAEVLATSIEQMAAWPQEILEANLRFLTFDERNETLRNLQQFRKEIAEGKSEVQ